MQKSRGGIHGADELVSFCIRAYYQRSRAMDIPRNHSHMQPRSNYPHPRSTLHPHKNYLAIHIHQLKHVYLESLFQETSQIIRYNSFPISLFFICQN